MTGVENQRTGGCKTLALNEAREYQKGIRVGVHTKRDIRLTR